MLRVCAGNEGAHEGEKRSRSPDKASLPTTLISFLFSAFEVVVCEEAHAECAFRNTRVYVCSLHRPADPNRLSCE